MRTSIPSEVQPVKGQCWIESFFVSSTLSVFGQSRSSIFVVHLVVNLNLLSTKHLQIIFHILPSSHMNCFASEQDFVCVLTEFQLLIFGSGFLSGVKCSGVSIL